VNTLANQHAHLAQAPAAQAAVAQGPTTDQAPQFPSAALGRPTQIDRPTHRRWDDAPLRTKLMILITLAAVTGALCGAVMVRTADQGMGLSVTLSVSIAVILWLAFRWIARPVERLASLSEQLDVTAESQATHRLPLARADELGRLARSMHRVHAAATQHHQEIGQLRRSLDHRIAQATRQATIRLQQMALRDPLTELGNRRFFDENFPELFETCAAAADDLACVLMDMDNFKHVNDTLGHAAGDELLIFLASLLRACVRPGDYAARLGGDEFVVLIPGCQVGRVAQFTQQLRVLFRQHVRIALPSNVNPDLSIGVAMLGRDRPATAQALLARADANLYAAKKAGKGTTVGL
jgi:diguanylate cyclase (GGDEF)-like protein